MKNPATVMVKSEFRKGTTKVFKNSEDQALHKKLSDPVLIIEAGRAAFFDIEGIENIELCRA